MSRLKHTRLTGIAMVMSLLVAGCSSDDESASAVQSRERRAVPVIAEAVQFKARRTRVEAVGTARARRSVSLFPEAAGEVVEVNFQPGDLVQSGEVLLALDSRDEKLALELAELRLADATRTLERYTQVNRGAELAVPETTVDVARTALDTARIERDRARIALQRRFVTAPFEGYVGITEIDAGDRIDPAIQITTIDDRSVLLVTFDVPEAFVGRLKTGDPVRVEVWSAERTEARGRIVDLGSRVDPVSRAFAARAEVTNADDQLRPGMSFRVELDLTGATFPSVPDVSLQWGAEGAFIWVVENDQARRIPANLVQRQGGRVLVDADISRDAMIIGEGVQSMREGLAVRTMDAAALARDARTVLAPAGSRG